MTQTVTLPDGSVHNFPDEATPDMIAGALGVQPPQPKIGAVEDVAKSVGSNLVGGGIDLGMALPNLLNAAVAGPQLLGIGIKDTIEGNPTTKNPDLWQPFFGSSDVEKYIGTEYQPQTIAGKVVALPTRILSGIGAAKGLQNAGNSKFIADETSGKPISAIQEKRLNYAIDLSRPKDTAAVIRDTALQRSSGGGITNEQAYTPTQRETDIANTIASTGVKKSNPLVDNLQIINNAKNAEAIRLKSMVEKANAPVGTSDFYRMGQKIAASLDENPLVSSDSETVTKVLKLAQSVLDKNPKTAAGLLQARKDFDFSIKQFQPSGLDTSSPATAFRYAAKVVRQSLNDTVGELVPDVEVGKSLMRQNHMYEAMDNIATKIPSQGTNRFNRFFQTPTGKIVKYGAGLTAAGAAGNYAVDKLSKP